MSMGISSRVREKVIRSSLRKRRLIYYPIADKDIKGKKNMVSDGDSGPLNTKKIKKIAESIKDIVVEDIMSADFEYISPQEPIDAIIKEFSSGRCTDLIVADTAGCFLGVITPIDLISHVNPSIGVRSRKKAPCIECLLRGDASVAEDIMARSHITVSADTPVVEALRLLEKYRHPDLVVTDKDGIVIGVLGICSIISHLRVVGHL